MSKARDLADLLDSNGDVKASGLDNVPPSNDASALTTGTLPVDRVPYVGRRNLIINGAMQVAQRGTSVTGAVTGYETIDRWRMLKLNVSTAAMDVSQSSESPDGFASSLKVDVTATEALGANETIQIQQRVEGQNLQALAYGSSAAKTTTISFWVRSAKTGTYIFEIAKVDGTVYTINKAYTIDAANTWEHKVITLDGNTVAAIANNSSTSFQIAWWLCGGPSYTSGTLNTSWAVSNDPNRAVGQSNLFDSTSNDFYITGVQLEVGSVATPFEHRSYGEELALCQRYYIEWKDSGDQQGNFNTTCTANDTVSGYKDLPVWMRVPPTVTSTSLQHSVGGLTNGLRTANQTGSESDQIFVKVNWTHAEANSHTGVLYTLDGGYVRADAEL